MTIWTHRCMLVPLPLTEQAAALCEQLAGPGGAGMFAHHIGPYGCSNGLIEDIFAVLLPLDVWDMDAEQYVRAEPGAAETIAQAAGVPADVVEALLDAVIVTADDWVLTCGRLGITPSED